MGNEEERYFLFNTFGRKRFWIGGRKEGSGWNWSDGTLWNFNDWYPNQPSGDGDCTELLSERRHDGFNDLHCSVHSRPFVCQISTGPPSTVCQAGWSDFNGECYKYFSQEKTWDDAEDQCVAEQAHLVSIHSEEEHQFVVGLNGGAGFPWLGGRLHRSRFSFVLLWTYGTPWDYNNWQKGRRVDEGCVFIFPLFGHGHGHAPPVPGPWYSQQCSRLRPFVCKKGN